MVEYDVVNVPIVDIVNQIILFASKNRASDIHMDPRDDCLLIRMRIDGELRDHAKIPKAYERNLITRVKLISNMNITETRLPQDGAIKGRIEGKDLDMRVSVLPTNEGEKVVIRILDYSKSLNGLESLGFSPKNFELLKKMLSVPNGIILVTGATGSGKSTTTYSMLQALNKEETNIITVEDPIEMNIEGINQVQVNSEIGLTFATVLRSILRQDPNVILIGEIRDSETAQIAVRASITGHLVLSTLHTNNSLSTIERLLDMDVERYLLSSALTGIISQKLARKLCDKCKVARAPSDYEKEIFKLVLNKEVDTVYDAKGCPECTQGYHGRIAIEEVLYISDELKATLANPKTSKDELKKMVYTDDVTTLLGDGLEKIISGDTSFDELFKLIEVDLEIQTIREESIERTERRERNMSNKGNLLGNLIIEAPEAPTPEAPPEGEVTNEGEEEAEDNVIKLPSTANIIIQAPVNTATGPSLDIPTGDSVSTPIEEPPKDQTEVSIPSSEEVTSQPTETTTEQPQVETTPTEQPVEVNTPTTEELVINEPTTEQPQAETTPTEQPIPTTENNTGLFGNSNEDIVDEEIISDTPTETNNSNNSLFGNAVVEEQPKTEKIDQSSSQGLFGNGIHTSLPEENNEVIEDNTQQLDSEVINVDNNDEVIEPTIEEPIIQEEQIPTETKSDDKPYNYQEEISNNSKKFDYLFKYLENEVINGKDEDAGDEEDPGLNNFVPDKIKNDPLESFFRNNN